MNNKSLLDDILDLSEQIGILRGQRMCYGSSQQGAIIEHGLRSALYEKKQKLMEMMMGVEEKKVVTDCEYPWWVGELDTITGSKVELTSDQYRAVEVARQFIKSRLSEAQTVVGNSPEVWYEKEV